MYVTIGIHQDDIATQDKNLKETDMMSKLSFSDKDSKNVRINEMLKERIGAKLTFGIHRKEFNITLKNFEEK